MKIFQLPLDHIFHTPKVAIKEIKVLSDINSDHLPITASFDILKGYETSGDPDEMTKSDKEEFKDVTKKAKSWDGPEKKIKKEES